MRTNAARKAQGSETFQYDDGAQPEKAFGPARSEQAQPPRLLTLRMYTEEEVSAILKVSLSQLRKWRMARNSRKAQGPPFKKIGRLVRYPEQALLEYINGK